MVEDPHEEEENIMALGQHLMKTEAVEIQKKNEQINELSDMVKLLLSEQRNLKDKFQSQEQKI